MPCGEDRLRSYRASGRSDQPKPAATSRAASGVATDSSACDRRAGRARRYQSRGASLPGAGAGQPVKRGSGRDGSCVPHQSALEHAADVADDAIWLGRFRCHLADRHYRSSAVGAELSSGSDTAHADLLPLYCLFLGVAADSQAADSRMTTRADLEQSLLLDPFDNVRRAQYAELLLESGDLEPAFAQFELLCRQSPQHAAAHVGAARALHKLNRDSEALSRYSRAKQLEGFAADPELDRIAEAAQRTASHGLRVVT